MRIEKMDNNPTFGIKEKLLPAKEAFKKLSKDIGCEPEVLAGAVLMVGSAGSASSLESANYSGLEKVLPINVSIPLGISAFSAVVYKFFVDKANEKAKKAAKNAKRRGQEVPQQADPDFIKVICRNIKERLKTLFKVKKEGN